MCGVKQDAPPVRPLLSQQLLSSLGLQQPKQAVLPNQPSCALLPHRLACLGSVCADSQVPNSHVQLGAKVGGQLLAGQGGALVALGTRLHCGDAWLEVDRGEGRAKVGRFTQPVGCCPAAPHK